MIRAGAAFGGVFVVAGLILFVLLWAVGLHLMALGIFMKPLL